MKRSWIGFVMLLLLLLGSFLSSRTMVKIHEPIEGKLHQSAQCAMEGNWKQAEDLFREAEDTWEKWEHFRSCFADHTPVEEIDGEFQMLRLCCAVRETVTFAGGCHSLARQVAAVGEAHELVWWNLL